jgi:3-oxoacyl-[acyl-carrier protein] reductase
VIETDLIRNMVAARAPELVAGISLGRLGTPEDIAEMVAYLATAKGNYLSGQAIVIDGMQWSA